jgi:hypothetical protein
LFSIHISIHEIKKFDIYFSIKSEWLKNINKWAAIPKIEIDFVSLKDYNGYREIFNDEIYLEQNDFVDNSEKSFTISTVVPSTARNSCVEPVSVYSNH